LLQLTGKGKPFLLIEQQPQPLGKDSESPIKQYYQKYLGTHFIKVMTDNLYELLEGNYDTQTYCCISSRFLSLLRIISKYFWRSFLAAADKDSLIFFCLSASLSLQSDNTSHYNVTRMKY